MDSIKTVTSIVLPYEEGFVYVKTVKDKLWGLPGGKLDSFEEIRVGLTREAYQETGLEVVPEYFLGVWDFKSSGGNPISNRVFAGKIVSGPIRIIRPDEILEARALSLTELRQLFNRQEIRSGRANLDPIYDYLAGVKYPISLIHTLF